MSDFSPSSPTLGHYQCQRCGACCRWPGNVRLLEGEVESIAGFLGLSPSDFIETYTRIHTQRDGLSLIEKANDECIFLEAGGCVINPVKPQQCLDFPNKWNFPGWQEICQARWVETEDEI